MIAKEQMQALRKADLADVCEVNGEFMHSDMQPLTSSEAKKVEEVMSVKHPEKKKK